MMTTSAGASSVPDGGAGGGFGSGSRASVFARGIARITAGHFAPKLEQIAYVREGASFRTALGVLREHNLSAVPVFRHVLLGADHGIMPVGRCAHETCIGFVDVMDLAGAIFHRVFLSKDDRGGPDNVGGIVNFNGDDSYVTVTEETPLLEVVAIFARGVHRIAVVAGHSRSHLLSIITQSAVVAWVAAQFRLFGALGRQSLAGLALTGSDKRVVCAASSDVASKALQMMLEGDLSGMPIINDLGVLVTGVGVSDCRYLASLDDAGIVSELDRTSLDFIMSLRERAGARLAPVYAVHPEDSLEVVCCIMTAASVHRVFVVDASYRPVAVVTMSDVCRVMLEFST